MERVYYWDKNLNHAGLKMREFTDSKTGNVEFKPNYYSGTIVRARLNDSKGLKIEGICEIEGALRNFSGFLTNTKGELVPEKVVKLAGALGIENTLTAAMDPNQRMDIIYGMLDAVTAKLKGDLNGLVVQFQYSEDDGKSYINGPYSATPPAANYRMIKVGDVNVARAKEKQEKRQPKSKPEQSSRPAPEIGEKTNAEKFNEFRNTTVDLMKANKVAPGSKDGTNYTWSQIYQWYEKKGINAAWREYFSNAGCQKATGDEWLGLLALNTNAAADGDLPEIGDDDIPV